MPNKDKATDDADNPFYYKRLQQKEMMYGPLWRSRISRIIATLAWMQSLLCDHRRLPNPPRTLPRRNERGADASDAIQRILQNQVHRDTGEETDQDHYADALE